MRKQFVSIALVAVLATMAAGCQKEDFVELQPTVAEIGAARTTVFTIDGQTQRVTLYGDAAWDAFLDRVMTLTDQGHSVEFYIENAVLRNPATKDDVQKKTTPDREEAEEWLDQKSEEGYSVSVKQKDNQYECLAYKK